MMSLTLLCPSLFGMVLKFPEYFSRSVKCLLGTLIFTISTRLKATPMCGEPYKSVVIQLACGGSYTYVC